MSQSVTHLETVESLQSLLVSRATGLGGDNDEYVALRKAIIERQEYSALIPKFVKTYRDIDQFWQFIKHKFPSYAERRMYLWEEFRPLLERIEQSSTGPADYAVSAAIEKFDAEHLQAAWSKALERRQTDPEGA